MSESSHKEKMHRSTLSLSSLAAVLHLIQFFLLSAVGLFSLSVIFSKTATACWWLAPRQLFCFSLFFFPSPLT